MDALADTPAQCADYQLKKSSLDFFTFLRRTFACGACSEFLADPITLPCGESVCRRCLTSILSTSQTSSSTFCKSKCSSGSAAFSEQTYSCPTKSCTRRHSYRNESTAIMVAQLLDKYLPVVSQSYALCNTASELMKNNRISTWDKCRSHCLNSWCPGRCLSLHYIIDTFLTPAVFVAPFLQYPLLLRSRLYYELGLLQQSLADIFFAIKLNPENGKGQHAQSIVLSSACSTVCIPSISTYQQYNHISQFICNLSVPQIVPSDFECSLCYNTIYEPVTCPCGHTWCRDCALRLSSLEEFSNHTPSCPLCRAPLPCYKQLLNQPSNKIVSLFVKAFPDSVGREIVRLELKIPIITCSLVFPNMPCFFNFRKPENFRVFRFCMDSNTPFGICLPSGCGCSGSCGCPKYVDYGTTVNVTCHEMVDSCDGPSCLVKAVGGFRFHVLRREVEDGMDVAYVERVEDTTDSDDESDDEGDWKRQVCEDGCVSADTEMSFNDTDYLFEEDAKSKRFSACSEWSEPGDTEEMYSCPVEKFFQMHACAVAAITNVKSCIMGSTKEKSRWWVCKESNPDPPSALETSIYQTRTERMRIAKKFVGEFTKQLSDEERERFDCIHGTCPESDGFAFWLAGMLPGVDVMKKYALLKMRKASERLKVVVGWVKERESALS